MTVGQLKKLLRGIPDSDEIIFGAEEFLFSRIKRRGDHLVQIEFERREEEDTDKAATS